MRIISILIWISLIFSNIQIMAKSPILSASIKDRMVKIETSKKRGSLIQMKFGNKIPFGNWSNYYGPFLESGIQYSWLNESIIYGLSSTYLFGNNVKNLDEILEHLITRNGEIMSNDGSSLSSLQSEIRGGQIGVHIGSLIPKWGNKNNQPLILLEAGMIQHKRKFISSGGVPQLEIPYIYGLDNLHRGFYLQENIGWIHIGENAPHFKIELQTIQSRTRLVREYQFNLDDYDYNNKWDFGIGFRVTWILPMLREKSETIFYY